MQFYKFFAKKLCVCSLAAASLAVSAFPVQAAEETVNPFTSKFEERILQVREERNTFKDTNEDIVFIKDCVAKDTPDDLGVIVREFKAGDTATLVGTNEYASWKIAYEDEIYYVNHSNFEVVEQEEETAEEEAEAQPVSTYNTEWTGAVLSRSAGVVYGPTGKETYYNLPMEGVVSIMRSMGNTDEYWIREDGVKMLGNYVMVAANLSVFPRGSLVPCSLGMGIVCDTGGFAAANPYQLDIAVNW